MKTFTVTVKSKKGIETLEVFAKAEISARQFVENKFSRVDKKAEILEIES
jgi:hypothetical protein